MELINIGKIVGTHGIKGEIKIISNFEFKEKVFTKDFNIYINKNKKEKIISYRKHKNYDMILLEGYNNINQVLDFKNQYVYIDKDDLNLKDNEILDEDIIGMDAYLFDDKIGIVNDIYNVSEKNKIIEINFDHKKILIPYHKDFIKEIDKNNNKIIFKKEGVINNEN